MAGSPASSDPYAVVRAALAELGSFIEGDPQTIQEAVVRAAANALNTYLRKDPGYGGSWARRGWRSAFDNVSRKYDRADVSYRRDERARPDDARDLATYALLHYALDLLERPTEHENLD